jgi:asparagine synthase (glutamine-hydrolysing)
MCGIVGIAGGSDEQIKAMVAALEHRGPDGSGLCNIAPDVALGHTRLAIIDTSAAGQQPMMFRKWVITYNGEIYNYRELRAHLETKGHAFTTQTDTEVLLHAWAEYGAACLPMLDGMFAFAIYDTENRELTLVRDRAGEKPLYWLHRDDLFAFASELRALSHLSERQVSQESLALYALYRYVAAPRSIWGDVQKLLAGHLMVVKADRSHQIRRWYSWEVEPAVEASVEGFKGVCAAVEAALVGSVRRRLISDVPLGMFLSGGIDSGLTAAIAARLGASPKTFSIGFEGKDSEHEQARAVANHIGAEHHEHVFGAADFERVGRSIGDRMDEPNGDRSCLPAYLLSGFVKQHVTVALSGDGGDELFGGYGRYFHECPEARTYYDRLLPVYGVQDAHHDEIASAKIAFQTHGSLHACRLLDFNRYLPGCVLSKMDRMAMRHSLEVRTPFLSPDVLEIARTLPAAYLMNAGMGKLVLREIASKYLPHDIVVAPKRGFGTPKSVFAANSNAMAEMYEDAVPHCARVAMPKPPNNINAIWAYIVLGQWLRSLG